MAQAKTMMVTRSVLLLVVVFLSTSGGLLFHIPSSLSTSSSNGGQTGLRHPSTSLKMRSAPISPTWKPGDKNTLRLARSDVSVARSPHPVGLGTAGVTTSRKGRDDGKSPDFEVNLGRVIETLRRDYPMIFFDPPSFDIYTPDIELRDPTGVAFRGMTNYKRVFATLRFFRQVLMNDASTTLRINYDWSKQQVRVTWNMVLVLKARQRPIYVDGISAYHINSDGMAYRHELETVIVNGTPVEPPYAYAWINLPAWVSMPQPLGGRKPAAIPAPTSSVGVHPFDRPELEGDVGGLLRAFGTDPLLSEDLDRVLTVLVSVEEPEILAGGTGDIDGTEAVVPASDATASAGGGVKKAEEPKKRVIREKKGWWGLEGPQGCETSFDCSGGMVCCDLLVVKVCCSNGIKQPKYGDLVPSLIPVPGRGRTDDDGPYGRRRPSSW